jgi:hypothetical protein
MVQELGFSINKIGYLLGVTLFFIVAVWWTWFYDEAKIKHKKDNPIEADHFSTENFQTKNKR